MFLSFAKWNHGCRWFLNIVSIRAHTPRLKYRRKWPEWTGGEKILRKCSTDNLNAVRWVSKKVGDVGHYDASSFVVIAFRRNGMTFAGRAVGALSNGKQSSRRNGGSPAVMRAFEHSAKNAIMREQKRLALASVGAPCTNDATDRARSAGRSTEVSDLDEVRPGSDDSA